MNEQRPIPLNQKDYDRMQGLVFRLFNEGVQSGADSLTLAHALFPLGLVALLEHHDDATVLDIASKQIPLLRAQMERGDAKHLS
ncbi:hypothetical protein [Tropicimonas isoalkanivorans]|uniref:Uncharacterized protein n=1 Tax=Tropicimonas isoalkanivorans TaxID=441112 RepID=A0A1I1LXG1_9RHOB|nr:hypothetical protein [Tropicimonas isoalkanivorans]SFC77804.1 hypothetical protein SAMN04488094_10963 [Tropicimonas isoalkanivorans]